MSVCWRTLQTSLISSRNKYQISCLEIAFCHKMCWFLVVFFHFSALKMLHCVGVLFPFKVCTTHGSNERFCTNCFFQQFAVYFPKRVRHWLWFHFHEGKFIFSPFDSSAVTIAEIVVYKQNQKKKQKYNARASDMRKRVLVIMSERYEGVLF